MVFEGVEDINVEKVGHTVSIKANSALNHSRRTTLGTPLRVQGYAPPGFLAMNYVEFMAMHPTWCMAPGAGFEPTTLSLTATRSTIELPRNAC